MVTPLAVSDIRTSLGRLFARRSVRCRPMDRGPPVEGRSFVLLPPSLRGRSFVGEIAIMTGGHKFLLCPACAIGPGPHGGSFDSDPAQRGVSQYGGLRQR